MLDTEIDWERRKKSEDWVREKSKEYDLHELTFAEWLYIEGARDFAEWLCEKYSRIRQDSIGLEKFQNIYWKSIDEVLAEWKKEKE